MILQKENGGERTKELIEKLQELKEELKEEEKKYLKNITIVLMEIKEVFGIR